ncbi:MAG: hypothetical protein ACP5TK_02515 [Candidatus Micrarchaeia archaeon]
MKMYIISNAQNGEELFELLDKRGISAIVNETGGGLNSIKNIVERVSSTGSGYMLVIQTNDPFSAEIELNKIDNVRAVMCNSAEDVQEAMKRESNAIIIGKNANADEVIAAIYGLDKLDNATEHTGGIFRIKKHEDKRGRMKGKQEVAKENIGGSIDDKEETEEDKENGAEEKDEEESDEGKGKEDNEGNIRQEKRKGKGVIGSLKDMFGVVD